MQSSINDRIRIALDTTQENIETAFGSAVSGWAWARPRYLDPYVTGCIDLLCCCRPSTRSRNDVFFDMYDENDREELERLIQDEDELFGNSDEEFGQFVGENASQRQSRLYTWWTSLRKYITPVTFGGPGQQSILHYRPSTAGLTGMNGRQRRSRSSTKSSVQSSDTFRSRTELLGEEEYIENDAQIFSDNFDATLSVVSTRSKSDESVKSDGSQMSQIETNEASGNEQQASISTNT